MSDDASELVPLRLLIVEDNPVDDQLLRHALRRAGFDPIGPRVDTEEGLAAQLDASLDVILADYSLPRFDAPATVRRVRATGLDVPVIVVSGAIGEDLAVAAMRQGAVDYVLKDRLGRLGEAVRLAVEQRRLRAEQKAAAEALRQSERRLAEAQAIAHVGSWDWDLETGEVIWSDELHRIFSLRPDRDQLSYAMYLAHVHPDDQARVDAHVRRAVDAGAPFQFECRIVRADGTERAIDNRGRLVLDEHGRSVRMQGSVQDITERTGVEAELDAERVFLHAVLDGVEDGIIACNGAGELTFINRAARRFHGLPLEPVPARELAGFFDLYDADGTTPLRPEAFPLARALRGEEVLDVELVAKLAGERRRSLFVSGRPLAGSSGKQLGAVVRLHDVTDRKTLEQQLRHQAFHDALTGLPNRALLFDRLSHALLRASRRGTRVAVLFLDIDNFKIVNDNLGHAAGDELLADVGRRLRLALRDGDTVARVGGDEFICILEDLEVDEAMAAAAAMAARIAARLRPSVTIGRREVVATASIGIAVSGVPAEQPDDLLRQADQALYAAKRVGKGRAIFFDLSMSAQAWARLEIESELRLAIARVELQLFYQPIVDLESGRICAVEALVRWLHPSRGLIGPAEFVSIAEESDLIVELGRWVIGEACRHAAAWRTEAEGSNGLAVSVNLSARQLGDPSLVDDIANALEQSGLPPWLLTLEITERVALSGDAATRAALGALKDVGVRLAIDDFGTGYSGLSLLKSSPVDAMKIDQSFIAGLVVDKRDAAIVRAVLALADALGLETTAEGVETDAQAEALKQLGCRRAQGFLFARPMPAAELRLFLNQSEERAALAVLHP